MDYSGCMSMGMLAQQLPNAPWWGVAVIAGLFGIGGGGIALLSSYLSDLRKDKQATAQQRHEWARERQRLVREAAAAFIVAHQEYRNSLMAYGVKDYPEPPVPRERVLPTGGEEQYLALVMLTFVAPPDLIDIAERINFNTHQLEVIFMSERPKDHEDEYAQVSIRLVVDKNKFFNVARRYGGVEPLPFFGE